MNKELEKEAEKYKLSTANKMAIEKFGFIAGAKSKYVEKQKLEFAKTELEKFRSNLGGYDFLSAVFTRKLEIQIKELEQKLSEI